MFAVMYWSRGLGGSIKEFADWNDAIKFAMLWQVATIANANGEELAVL